MSKKACPYDPVADGSKAIGQFHCPLCGEMVIAGLPHIYPQDLDDLDPNNRSDADLAMRLLEIQEQSTNDSQENTPSVN